VSYPYQQPAYYPPPPAPIPSGATGITAGVLAALGALANFVGGFFMAVGVAALSTDSSFGESGFWGALMAVAILNIVAGVVLVPGTVLLLLRRMVGRWVVVAGCAISILSSLISVGLFATMSAYTANGVGTNAFSVVFPIVTLVLVLLPSTTAWIRAKQANVPLPYPPAPQQYPPQQYPPQQYPPQQYPRA